MRRIRSLRLLVGSSGPCAVLALLLAAAQPAGAVDLGDLDVPRARLTHPDGSARWYDPPQPADTSGWTVYNASFSGCSLADDSTNDQSCFARELAAARSVPGPVVMQLPAGTINFRSSYAFPLDRSNFVLRGASASATILKFHADAGASQCQGAPIINFSCIGQTTPLGGGASSSWIAGFDEDAVALTLSNASGFSVGDWIEATMNSGSNCLGTATNNSSFNHIAQVTAKSGNVITIDRPLRMDYEAGANCGAKNVRKIGAVNTNIGIENLAYVHASANVCSTVGGWKPPVAIGASQNVWVTGVRFQNWCNQTIHTADAWRVLIAHNHFKDMVPVPFSMSAQGIDISTSTDVYIIDNVFDNVKIDAECQEGSEGVVFAYNYETPGGAKARSYFMHGKYCRETLAEGNDLQSSIIMDNFWGRQGPRHTFYRNRLAFTGGSPEGWGNEWSITHDDFADSVMSTDVNVLVNSCKGVVRGAPTGTYMLGLDNGIDGMWLEKNVVTQFAWKNRDNNPPGTRRATTDCGDGNGCPSPPGDNAESNRPPGAWSSVQVPASLFLSSAPSWWCQEACSFTDPHNGIGALGDDWTGTLCKLPAQIRHQGGTCTPLSGGPPPPPPPPPPPTPPAAPFLLE